MATELASAYVTLIPSLKGAQKQIETQLGGMNLSNSGKKMGSSISSGIGSAFASVAKIGVGAVATIGAAVGGLAAGGGISRALKLDQANFKFKALGMDVESAMASCNDAVLGTAFGLDAAATVATQLGAAGVSSGDAMTGALKSVAGVAAMSGSSMEDIGAVFSKVAAKGKVGGDELLQLTERGINATAALAKYLGKPAEEVSKMVSSGKVDFATFSDAMEATFGEAASGANATFQGAMSNVMAALSRVGAKFASPALDGLRRVFVATIPAIDAIGKALEPVVSVFVKWVDGAAQKAVSVVESFTSALSSGSGVTSAFGAALETAFGNSKLWSFAEKLTSAVKGFFSAVSIGVSPVALLANYLSAIGVPKGAIDTFKSFGNAVMSVISPITSVIGNFISTFKNALSSGQTAASAFRTALYGVFNETSFQFIADALESPFSTVKERLSILVQSFESQFGMINLQGVAFVALFVGIAAKIAPAVSGIVGAFSKIGSVSGIINGLSGAISPIANGFKTLLFAITPLGGGLKGVLGVLGAMVSPVGLVIAAVSALAAGFAYLMVTNDEFRNTIGELVGQIGAALIPAVETIVSSVSALIAAVLPVVISIMGQLLPVIGQIIELIFQVIAALAPIVSTIISILAPALVAIIAIIANVVSIIVATVMPIVSAVVEVISSAMPVIQGVVEGALGVIGSVFSGVWNAIQIVVSTVMSVVQSIIDIALSAINGDWEGVWNGVKSLFSSIWDGILAAAKNGVDTVVNVVTGIKDTILGFFSGAGQWLLDAGSSIVQGLIDGITGMINAAGDAIGSVMSTISGFLPHSPAKKGAFSGHGWSLYSGQAITEALAIGISDRSSNAVAAMSGVMSEMSSVMTSKWDVGFNPQAYDSAASVESPFVSQQRLTNDVSINPAITKAEIYDAVFSAIKATSQDGTGTAVYIDGREATNILAPRMNARLGQIERRRAVGL